MGFRDGQDGEHEDSPDGVFADQRRRVSPAHSRRRVRPRMGRNSSGRTGGRSLFSVNTLPHPWQIRSTTFAAPWPCNPSTRSPASCPHTGQVTALISFPSPQAPRSCGLPANPSPPSAVPQAGSHLRPPSPLPDAAALPDAPSARLLPPRPSAAHPTERGRRASRRRMVGEEGTLTLAVKPEGLLGAQTAIAHSGCRGTGTHVVRMVAIGQTC